MFMWDIISASIPHKYDVIPLKDAIKALNLQYIIANTC